MSARGCSRQLQRVLSDFGLQHSFQTAANQVREHYGFCINRAAVRSQTLHHAKAITQLQDARKKVTTLPAKGAQAITAEADGTMLRIVTCSGKKDRRLSRKIDYREARLCAARAKGETSIVYEAGIRDVHEVGNLLGLAAKSCGWAADSHIHVVGDGAEWIHRQSKLVFGDQSTYLIDFFHLCEYLHAASEQMKKPLQWLKTQKRRLKAGRVDKVTKELEANLEKQDVADEDAPVRAAHRYITNRPGCFEYRKAIEQGLEIGSGMIESGHKHVLHARLKIPGAAWNIESVDAISQARAFRANGRWDSYWTGKRAA